MSPKKDYDEEELFGHTRMSLGDHIEELRTVLWRAIKGFIVAMILGFFVAQPVLGFLISPLHKVMTEMRVDQLKKEIEKEKQKEKETINTEKKRINVGELRVAMGLDPVGYEDKWIEISVVTTKVESLQQEIKVVENESTTDVIKAMSVTEPFMIWFKVAMYSGFVLASPWIFYQIWSFIGAGLYPHEKRYIHVFMPLSVILFIAGVCLCQFIVLPLGIRWLLDFSFWLGVKPDLRLSEWFSFALLVPIIFGIAFQLPVAMFGLERVGIFTVDSYRSKRRIAIFLIFLISGLANASPDPISMTMLAVPLCLLYELGIMLCRWWPQEELDLDVEESEEMVEV
jgi:sec-independent protein translocase protein TatC